ncbi:hypothetical protein PHYSODRAFT_450687, partial [Phytophthora sojae]
LMPFFTSSPVPLAVLLKAPFSIPDSFFNSGDKVTTSGDAVASVALPATTESPSVPSRCSDVSPPLLTYLKSPADVFETPTLPPADAVEISSATHATKGAR